MGAGTAAIPDSGGGSSIPAGSATAAMPALPPALAARETAAAGAGAGAAAAAGFGAAGGADPVPVVGCAMGGEAEEATGAADALAGCDPLPALAAAMPRVPAARALRSAPRASASRWELSAPETALCAGAAVDTAALPDADGAGWADDTNPVITAPA